MLILSIIAAAILAVAYVINAESGKNYELVFDKIVIAKEDTEYRNTTMKVRRINRTGLITDWETDFKVDVTANTLYYHVDVSRLSAGNAYDNTIVKLAYEHCSSLYSKILADNKELSTNEPRGCPKLKGHYYTYNSSQMPKNLPPYVPLGKYRASISHEYKGKIICVLMYYATVQKKVYQTFNVKQSRRKG